MVRWGMLATAAVVLLLEACGRKATGQSIAVVNDDEISRAELNAELQRIDMSEGPQAELQRRQLLETLIDRRLLAQRAVAEGVDRTPEFLMRDRQQREHLLVDLLLQRHANHVATPAPQQIAGVMIENPGLFDRRTLFEVEQIHFIHLGDAVLLNEVKRAQSLEQVSATLNRLGVPYQRRQSHVDTASISAEMFNLIVTLPRGKPFVIPSQEGFVVSVILSSRPVRTLPEEAQRLAVGAWRQQQLEKARQQQLRDVRRRARIDYQPGYEPLRKSGAATAVGQEARALPGDGRTSDD